MNTRLELTTASNTVHVLLEDRSPWARTPVKKTRVSVTESAETMERMPRDVEFKTDEGKTDFDAANRAWSTWRREALKEMRVRALVMLSELGFDDVKLSFSQKAGCSCGCSPAFVADRPLVFSGQFASMVWSN